MEVENDRNRFQLCTVTCLHNLLVLSRLFSYDPLLYGLLSYVLRFEKVYTFPYLDKILQYKLRFKLKDSTIQLHNTTGTQDHTEHNRRTGAAYKRNGNFKSCIKMGRWTPHGHLQCLHGKNGFLL